MEDERTLKHIAMMHMNTAGKAFMDTDDTVEYIPSFSVP